MYNAIMLIPPEVFQEEIGLPPEKRSLRIAFIGMSGAGKSMVSNYVSAHTKMKRIDIDGLIGERLARRLNRKRMDVYDVGKYLGMPYYKGFKYRERIYLDLEKKILAEEILPNSIVDTTGSTIYHPTEMEKIRKNTLIIYLKESKEHRNKLFQRFLKRSKPICWHGFYTKRGGESDKDSLERSYRALLEDKHDRYVQVADISISMHISRKDVLETTEASL